MAEKLDVPFVDGDSLHSAENIRLMASGHALTDEERLPWLQAVGEQLAAAGDSGIVVACSALKRGYRDLLREHAPALVTVYAKGDIELIGARISGRHHDYMPASFCNPSSTRSRSATRTSWASPWTSPPRPSRSSSALSSSSRRGPPASEDQQDRDVPGSAALAVRAGGDRHRHRRLGRARRGGPVGDRAHRGASSSPSCSSARIRCGSRITGR